MTDWQPPQCIHGHIILGCPHDDCPTQNAYLDQQRAAMREWDHRDRQAARDYVRSALGLPQNPYVCPECEHD